jgi:hypothetical protein
MPDAAVNVIRKINILAVAAKHFCSIRNVAGFYSGGTHFESLLG